MFGHKFHLLTNILKPILKDLLEIIKKYEFKNNTKRNSKD